MVRVRQLLDYSHFEPEEIPALVRAQLDRRRCARIHPGMSVAITCGSRGVANIAIITKAIVDFVADCGGEPFVFPAMGSHGGATAEGQTAILTGYGVTEDFLGCPIRSSMEVVQVGNREDNGWPVYVDKLRRGGGRYHSLRARQGPHRLPRPLRERHPEDGGHRHGQAERRGAGPSGRLPEMGTDLPHIAKVIFDNTNILGAVALGRTPLTRPASSRDF